MADYEAGQRKDIMSDKKTRSLNSMALPNSDRKVAKQPFLRMLSAGTAKYRQRSCQIAII